MNYTDYYKNHSYSKNIVNFNELDIYFDKNILLDILSFDKNIKILEIGSGQGKFAHFCKKNNFKNYIGFDLDNDILNDTKNKFPEYDFSNEDIFKYLNNNKDSFDLIFISHVFEHFDIEEGIKLSKLIYGSLIKGGKWINIMPNASSLFFSGYLRYNDITHKVLYTDNSFNQILLKNFSEYNIKHKNTIILGKNKLKVYFINNIIIRFIKYICKIIGFPVPKIWTLEIISIIKK